MLLKSNIVWIWSFKFNKKKVWIIRKITNTKIAPVGENQIACQNITSNFI